MSIVPEPFDPYCKRPAAEIDEIVVGAADEGVSPDEYAAMDGTFNAQTGEFACLACYIELGMPSSAAGWKRGSWFPSQLASSRAAGP